MAALKQTHLRFFNTVAELGSISAAAQKLHRSPSAVSMTISNLEKQFDRPLFEADGKSRLTPFGRYVYQVTQEQLNRFDHSVAGIQAYARNDFGRVDIAAVPSFATHYLPGLLTQFIEAHPHITLSIRDDSSTRISQLVETGEIDVGIGSQSNEFQGTHFSPLTKDTLGIVCARSHELNELNRDLTWEDLKPYRFIQNGTCALIHNNEFNEILRNSEIEVENTTSLLALVAEEVGITALPRLAVPEERQDVRFLKTTYTNLERTLGVITPTSRTLSPAASAFVACLSELG